MGARTDSKRWGNSRAFHAGLVLTGVIIFSAPPLTAKAQDGAQQSFWNTQEIASSNLRPFWKWRAVLERYSQETNSGRGHGCESSLFSDCPYDELRRFLAEIVTNDRWAQLVAVNSFFNARRYIPDERNWGIKDYWATPGEFMDRAGDCEDYAIAKYLSLRELGWSEGDLRVVVVRDVDLGVAHAVLVVAYGGQTWVLDNQMSGVNETSVVGHYRPVFSINETSWWHHQPDASAKPGRRPTPAKNTSKLEATPAAESAP